MGSWMGKVSPCSAYQATCPVGRLHPAGPGTPLKHCLVSPGSPALSPLSDWVPPEDGSLSESALCPPQGRWGQREALVRVRRGLGAEIWRRAPPRCAGGGLFGMWAPWSGEALPQGPYQGQGHLAKGSWKNAATTARLGGGGGREKEGAECRSGGRQTAGGLGGQEKPQTPSLSALGRDSEELNIIAERACPAPEDPRWSMHVHQRLAQEGARTRSSPLRPPGAQLGVHWGLLAPRKGVAVPFYRKGS